MATRLRQDRDVQESISDQRKRERELRLAKRQLIRKGDRAGAFELGEYGRKNGIDQRGVRRSEEVLANATARVAGERRDLATVAKANERTRQVLENGPVVTPAAAPATVNPKATPGAGNGTPVGSRVAKLASPSGEATPAENARAQALTREALAGNSEFGATAAIMPGTQYANGFGTMNAANYGFGQHLPEWNRRADLVPSANRIDRTAAPAQVQPGSTPSRSQLLGYKNKDAVLPSAAPAAASAPAPRSPEMLLPKGSAAPEGYTLVGLRGSNQLYRNDAETKDLVRSAEVATESNIARRSARDAGGRTPEEVAALKSGDAERLRRAETLGDRVRAGERTDLDGMDPRSKKLLLATEATAAKADTAERRRTMQPEARYAEDVTKRAADFDAEFGTGDADIAALKAERDSGQLDDDAFEKINQKIKAVTARELYTKYGIDTRKKLRTK